MTAPTNEREMAIAIKRALSGIGEPVADDVFGINHMPDNTLLVTNLDTGEQFVVTVKAAAMNSILCDGPTIRMLKEEAAAATRRAIDAEREAARPRGIELYLPWLRGGA